MDNIDNKGGDTWTCHLMNPPISGPRFKCVKVGEDKWLWHTPGKADCFHVEEGEIRKIGEDSDSIHREVTETELMNRRKGGVTNLGKTKSV
jgi:hypothetical protein